MPSLKSRILEVLQRSGGATDRELAEILGGRGSPQQAVNQACRALTAEGALKRVSREDGLVGNYLQQDAPQTIRSKPTPQPPAPGDTPHGLSEDEVKRILAGWLEAQGWTLKIAWAKERGIDIEATRAGKRWIIEVKGCGSLQPMRVNYFLMILGELLQRMSDQGASYSIALPDMPQFRGLWSRLPVLAKQRTEISALFVSADGTVVQD